MKKFVKFLKSKLAKRRSVLGILIKKNLIEDSFNVVKVDDILKSNDEICFNKLENN